MVEGDNMLINCPECGKEVSDKAKICPNCGFSISDYIKDKLKSQLEQEEDKIKEKIIKDLVENISLPEEPQKPKELEKPNTLFNTLFDISIGLLMVGAFCFLGYFSDGTEEIMVVSGICLTVGLFLLLYSSSKKDEYKQYLNIYEKEYAKYACAANNQDEYKKNTAENQYYAKKYEIPSKCPVCELSNESKNILSKWEINKDDNIAICNACGYKTQIKNNSDQKPIHIQYNKTPKTDHKPKCPTCGSSDIEKISMTSKAVSGVALGIYSNNIRKTFHCKKCGYKW